MSSDMQDDEVTLLQPCQLEDNVDEDRENHVDKAASSEQVVGSYQSPSSWHLPLASLVLVFAATALVVTLPVYLQAINIGGTAYSGILFVWLIVSLSIVLYSLISYYPFFYRPKSYSRSVVSKVVQYGCWHGVACIAVVYALDRKRVLCHAQEPLMGLIVLYMILLYCFYRGPVMSSSKLVCLCGVLAGLFLAMDFQLNDIYLCRGITRTSPASDGGDWSMQEHALWTIVYAAALFLYTMAWIKLEHLMMNMSKLRCSADEVNTVCGQLVLSSTAMMHHHHCLTPAPPTAVACQNASRDAPAAAVPSCSNAPSSNDQTAAIDGTRVPDRSASEVVVPIDCSIHDYNCGLQHHGSCPSISSTTSGSVSGSTCALFPISSSTYNHTSGFTRDKFNALMLCFTLSTLFIIVALFWTDMFTALGKSGSVTEFVNLTYGGVSCHFKGFTSCGPTALHGWLMVVYMLLFLWSVRELCLSSRSLIFPLSVASLALPLSALFWGAFSEGGPYGIMWAPTVTGELIFSSLGLPVMVTFLTYWAKIDQKEATKAANAGAGFAELSSKGVSPNAEPSSSQPVTCSGGPASPKDAPPSQSFAVDVHASPAVIDESQATA